MTKTSMRPAGASTRAAASPAVAGFRPMAMALAVAGAFAGAAQAQPTGAQAIHGKALLQQQGNTLVVTTQNGAGTNHSAINWQSFSIPGGTTTRFDQPSATSTSVNRVLGNNPSQIFGTLSSNGKLVLVNPAGIAVGAGAVVDTAGFTASTLRMSDADALAGRLVFGDGTGGGLLNVSGQIIARQGDVVLIAPDVRVGADAIVQAPNGATLLAAGQKVALTGRGLEGIQLELQAPQDQAINLGTLQGDAVGIFASQLKHSGAIQATGVSVEGGKVVLKAADTADIAGRVTATRGTVGGQVHATAGKVMLRSGAVIDVSGRDGGGEALIGGGWQGQDSRIANATETTIEAGATVRADAVERGNGGTIVAWSDGATRVYGSLSARGGAESGDGGKVETSGHYLDMQGQVDTRAPNGRTGELLLDPTNVWIANDLSSAQAAGMLGSDTTNGPPPFGPSNPVSDSLVTVSSLQGYLASNNVTVKTQNASGTGAGNITVVDPISWTSVSASTELGLWADKNIAINGAITNSGGSLVLRADGGSITQSASGAISTSGLVAYAQGGSVNLAAASNNVSSLAGYASTTGGFSFSNSGSLSIDSRVSANGMGLFNGVVSGGPVSIGVTGGDLTINDTNYGINAGSNAVTLNVAGAVSEAANAKLTAGSLDVTAADISLTGNISTGGGAITLVAGNKLWLGTGGVATLDAGSGSVKLVADEMAFSFGTSVSSSSLIEVQTKTAGQAIKLGATTAPANGVLELDFNTMASFSTPGVLRIGSATSGALTINSSIAPSAGTLSLVSGSTISQDPGAMITAPKLALQAGGNVTLTAANMVGEVAAKLTGTNANFSFRSGQKSLNVGVGLDSVSGVMLSGDASNFDPLNPNTVIALTSAGTLTQSAGAQLAGKAVYAEGASVILTQANPTGVIAGKATGVFHYTSSNGIAVSTVNGFSGVQNAAGGTGADAIVLNGTSVSQSAGASIVSAGGLQVYASAGDVFLPESGNSVASLSGSASGSFKFLNTGNLVLNGVSAGGSVYVAGGGALSLSQGIVAGAGVKLSGASVSQVAGASIVAGSGGLQVSASSGGIQLDDNGNSVGFLTGSALGDIHFHDAGALSLGALSSSSGMISITSAGALTATQNISAPAGVDLGGSSISQIAGASIVSAGGLLVNATSGSVALGDAGNNVASFTGSAFGDIGFYNAGSLTLGSLSASTGSVMAASGGALTVPQNIAAGNGIFLGAQGGDLNVGASLNAGSGGVSLGSASGSVLFNGAVGISGAGDAFFSAPVGAVRIASGTTTLSSNVASTQMLEVGGGTLNAGSAVTIPNLLLASGTLQGADVTIGSHLDWTGGAMTGSGKTIVSGSATADIYGPVTLARKVVNDGSIFLWGSGTIAVGSGFELVNNGLFEILNDGGFSGGVGSIQNSGTFRKGATATATTTTSPLAFAFTTGATAVDVASFSNTGTLEVNQGTLQFAPLAFGTNAGLIWLQSGATLDNSNTTLASSGWIKGSGTLALGTGSLENSGGLAPGGIGGIGSLAIQAATVNLQSGSSLLVDVADALSYDTLQVSGNVNVASGAGITVNTGSATLLPGDSLDVIASSAGTVGGVLPTVSGFDTAFVASPASLRLSVPLPPPAPAPAPSGSALVDRILEIVPDASTSLVTAMLSEQDNTLTTFTTLLLEEEQAQAKDAVVNEVSGSQICKP